MKEFFKPTWMKEILFTVIFILITYFGLSTVVGIGPKSYYWIERGFPMFYLHLGEYGPHSEGVYISNLILDIIIYFVISYLLSCLIVWIYNKVKKK